MPNTFTAPAHVIVQTIGDEMVFFHTTEGRYLTLDAVGARVYTLLLECGRDGTCARLVEEFQGDEATINADVAALIDQLVAAGLIEPGAS